ncbi:MAG: CHASE2 domain-containing protein [Armatimonadetes bacterium]|nr:CHASE2 domain-containing protein [Armatimonadota bacterium]
MIATLLEGESGRFQREQWAVRSTDKLHNLALSQERLGYNNVVTDLDGLVRRIPIMDSASDATRSFGGFATRLAELAQEESFVLGAERARLGGREVELGQSPAGWFLRLNYVGPAGYAGKCCIVAPVDPSFQDIHETPLGPFPGAEITKRGPCGLVEGAHVWSLIS